MEDQTLRKGTRGRGVEFCCLSYPLIKSGAYLIPLEFAFVSGCVIVLTTTTPTIVAAVDTSPMSFRSSSSPIHHHHGMASHWPHTIRIEMSSIYRLYIRVNFLLVLVIGVVGAIGTVVIASKHDQSKEVCTRIYGNPPLNSPNGVIVCWAGRVCAWRAYM